jgi:YebC/PmpR family DNA-binding regulatory protein
VVAAKMGGGDADSNPRLRAAIDKALSANMTRDTIERAVKRGAGGDDDQNLEELVYEGYGPGGTAIIVEAMTDNKNRTVAEVRHAFGKAGGNLGTSGSVSYLFSQKGQIVFGEETDEDQVMEIALEAGAEDVVTHEDGSIEVLTEPEDYMPVKDALVEANLEPVNAEITKIASTSCPLDEDTATKLLRLVDVLEDLDDTQNVYSNAEISAEVMAKISE